MRNLKVSLAGASALFLACGFAYAGDGNVLRLIQTSPSGAVEGNSIRVDQTDANRSLVSGPSDDMLSLGSSLTLDGITSARGDSLRAAVQNGDGNDAKIRMTGEGGEIQILQDNSSAGAGAAGNTAIVNALGAATLGVVLQTGTENLATLNLADQGSGLIVQNGSGNVGGLTVEDGGTGRLTQEGSLNNYVATVQPGTNTDITQIGNNQSVAGTQGISVFSTNPGTISITQTGF